jgi:hypothetical protein
MPQRPQKAPPAKNQPNPAPQPRPASPQPAQPVDPALLTALKQQQQQQQPMGPAQGYDDGGTVQPDAADDPSAQSYYNTPTPVGTVAVAAPASGVQALAASKAPQSPLAPSGGPGGGIGGGSLRLGQFTDAPPVPRLDSFTNAYNPALPQGTQSQAQIAQQRAAALQPFLDALARVGAASSTQKPATPS